MGRSWHKCWLWAAFSLASLLGMVGMRGNAPTPLDPLVYVSAVTTGGKPDGLVMDECSNPGVLVYYDQSADVLHFLDTATSSVLPESTSLPSWNDKIWIVFDRRLCLGYIATTRLMGTSITWQEARLHILDDREIAKTVSVNYSLNYGKTNPPDSQYKIEGLVLKQSGEEGSDPARIILDNTRKGRIDVIDLSADGLDIARSQRFAYAERDLMSGPINFGNSLALEARHETLAIDDMVGIDHLYISDPNYIDTGSGRGFIRVVQMGNPLLDLNASLLPEINLSGITPPFFYMGTAGIAVSGPRDRLYVASASGSFNTGRVEQVRTTNHTSLTGINLNYGTTGEGLVDWYDPQRLFVATYDDLNAHEGLWLHLIYDASVVDTLQVLATYDETNSPLREMAFDPVTRRLYMAVGGQIHVVQVNYGLGPKPPPLQNPIYIPIARKN